MPDVKSHKQGSFSWADLATKDAPAAKKYYSELFGWKLEDSPMPQGGSYTMGTVQGKSVAGLMPLPQDEQKMGIPSHWNCYVNVQNVDEIAKKAGSLGAKILAQPMDVMDVGRMAVLQDPSGAPVSLWQPKRHTGAGLMGEHGTPCWFELESRNVDAAGGFYAKLFGWSPQTQDMGQHGKYTVFKDGQEQRAGMMAASPQTPANVPSHWTVYFQVNDCNAAVKKSESLKGRTIVPGTDIPEVGRFAILSDPTGAIFGVLQPLPRR